MTGGTAGLLDAARGGRAMAGVMAIMLFLTLLAAAGGIATARAADGIGDALAGRATVQIVLADPAARARAAARALAALRRSPAVLEAQPVPRAELERLLGPWVADADLSLPALIDLRLASDPRAEDRVRAVLARAAPGARLDRHGDALAPVAALLGTLTLLAAGLVALMALAAAAVVWLAARAGLERHRATIDIMHGLGATDAQVARLFERRIARDAGLGAVAGAVAAWLVVALVQRQVAGAGSALLGAATLDATGWAALAVLPVLFVLFAMAVARGAITRALGRVL